MEIGSLFKISSHKDLLKLYYNVIISEQFADCADNQLPVSFSKKASTNLTKEVFLNWNPDERFVYEKDVVSRISVEISLKYGSIQAKIAWRSKSGHVYDIADDNIDCNDIEFWFEGIDPDYCYRRMYPQWSLFTFPESTVEDFNIKSDLKLSLEFIRCADKQLSPKFETATGLKINKHISCSIRDREDFAYVSDSISGLAVVIYINHNWNYDVTMIWRSKSGRVYKLDDPYIDCNDIEFWLEGLDAVLYHKQMFPKAELPFKLKNLSYQLVINRLNMNCILEMTLKDGEKEGVLIKKIDDFIAAFNENSEKKYRADGIVHNWLGRFEKNKLVYDIDTGFSGPALMKKLLPFLSSLNSFTKIEIN